jgi:hypothetical protein
MLGDQLYKETKMENEFGLEDLEERENFRINPHIWLRSLLAIVGDKDKKRDIVQKVAQKSDLSSEQVEVIIAKTIGILINQTRAN